MKSSAELLAFYIAYNEWLETGDDSFCPGYGLCANLFDFYVRNEELMYSVLDEMHGQFRLANLDETLPFNEDGMEYFNEKMADSCPKNPKRVAWVKARIAEMEGEIE